MELRFKRKITLNTYGSPYLILPKPIFEALGTRDITLRVLGDHIGIFPEEPK